MVRMMSQVIEQSSNISNLVRGLTELSKKYDYRKSLDAATGLYSTLLKIGVSKEIRICPFEKLSQFIIADSFGYAVFLGGLDDLLGIKTTRQDAPDPEYATFLDIMKYIYTKME